MLFNSWQFAVFFPCVFLLYYAIPHRVRWVFLLIASYYFYMSWDARLVWLIAAVTLVSYLTARIIGASEKKTVRRAALVGVGNLGRALLNHQEFRRRGFTIVAAFDCDPFKIGETAYGLEVFCTKTLAEKLPELDIEIGIVTTPPERAQRAANQLVDAGIKGILNFAPARISVPDHVFVEYVDFFHQIYSLTFNISTKR